MFHQILVRPEDRSAQLFLWRDSPDKPLETMVMDVAIFGATCSPAHAQFVKNLNASEHQHDYPRAVDAITRWHYVDDYIQCVDTIEEAVELALQVTEVHSRGKFEIVNWISNRNEVLEQIGANNPRAVKNMHFGEDSEGQRLLGMIWQPSSDVFSFPVQFCKEIADLVNCKTIPTKRQLLKLVMSLYDPLGLISVFTIHGKIIIQEVWRERIDWDEQIPTEIFTKWKQWLSALPDIESLKIKRCYFPGYSKNTYDHVQLHIFVDASEQAYAAVAYLRVVEGNQIRCALVSSKTKVAPLKILSIPRLELLAALIGARLRKVIEEEHTITIHEVFFWSDSTTVLSWIRSDMRRYNRFVAHRINEILELSKIEEWRWVPTRLNVADEATKWGRGPSFDAESRWYKAPEFLYELDENEWPRDRTIHAECSKEELRIESVHTHVARVPIIDVNRFSKWERILRKTGYVHYFEDCYMKTFLGKQIDTIGMGSDHLKRAERTLWRIAQNDSFSKEADVLRYNKTASVLNKRKISKSSPIASMGPTIDEFGVIRVDGRMQAADWMQHDAKYPIILPRDHRITHLILDWYHRHYGHANDETVVNELRQRFRIPRLRVELKKAKKACQWCKVYKVLPVAPKMGPLPRVRLTPLVRPFTFTGIDYFGPYQIKIGRKAVKRWVVLFTCLTLRAIHLEVVASMSSDSCKKAIRRFVARRGAPEEVYTDNGTNFLGVSRELQMELKAINNDLGSTFTDTRTQWFFIPPAAPHMGGCWERMVRSVKTALKSLPSVDKFDEESFHTVLIEAEHMINSRPLTFIPLKSENEESLTPNHFLMLGSQGVCQGVKMADVKGKVLRCSWDLIQSVLQNFWQRWVVGYLPTITRRTKWFEDVRPIDIGDLVVIADEGARNRWIRGRVIKVYPGKDGVSRMADVQSNGRVLSRPCTKLALLDVSSEHDAERDVLST
ncbi:uncharacterized protein LOC129753277 [Uranotaenia lowii]|uniref:uncharacterized protein LOC129753277 n=1 Tax=Uranotaenia lowii TaxID=190385 RepID=UPI002478CCC5|nr:uncharacterized protein LOC129753277 [Uranotaenia lowii]